MRARNSLSRPGLSGRYRLDGIVGCGRVVDVFRAWDLERRRPVAVKWVREGVHPSRYPQWRADSDELARLDHPGLVRERDHGTEDGRPFLVEDLAGTTTLEDACHARRLTVVDVASVGQQLSETLRYLHDNDVVLRQVTRDRVLVDLDTDAGCRVWLDCGPWVPEGPPRWDSLAPELRCGQEASIPGDVWGLGMVILECLDLHEPADAGQWAELPPLPPDLPDAWATLLPMMLDERPEHRPTAGQVAAVLAATRARTVQPDEDEADTRRMTRLRSATAWPRAGTMTTVTAAAAIVLLAVGMRVVRAEDESVPHDRTAMGPERVTLIVRTPAQPVVSGRSSSVTPTIRTVADVTPTTLRGHGSAAHPAPAAVQPSHGPAVGRGHARTNGRTVANGHGRANGAGSDARLDTNGPPTVRAVGHSHAPRHGAHR